MTLDELGWRGSLAGSLTSGSPDDTVGRVAVEHRTHYLLYTEAGEVTAEVAGKLRHDAECGQPPGLPAVGDWVRIRPLPGEARATIQAVLPRQSLFARKEAGKRAVAQVVAANVDFVFLVSALNGDVNPRRLERYLTMTWESGARPIVVLSKADLCNDVAAALDRVAAVASDVPVHVISTFTGLGLAELEPYFQNHNTVALLGSSGVGKSTLINRLIGQEVLRVQEVRDDGRGRHTTTHRALIPRPEGGLLLDTPGMRELQLWEGGEGVQTTFAEVEELAGQCRFRDCTHRQEPGCAVRAAVEAGTLSLERLESYHKLGAEIRHLESRNDAQAQSAKKQRDKLLHRAYFKHVKSRKN